MEKEAENQSDSDNDTSDFVWVEIRIGLKRQMRRSDAIKFQQNKNHHESLMVNIWKPLTLKHLPGGPKRFESRKECLNYLKQNNLVSPILS